MLTLENIKNAHRKIESHIRKTELVKSKLFPDLDLYLKLECSQLTNSFKLRGALSKMSTLTEEEKQLGVMTVSSGNHGAAVSYAAQLLGIKVVTIIVPKCNPQSKINNIKKYGGQVLILGETYDDAHILGEAYREKNNLTYIDAYYEDEFIYAGQGTIGLEIMEQLSDVDIIIVPVGGGGLISGIGTAAKGINPDVKIIGLQTSACPAMIKAIEDNKFYDEYPTLPTVCDALVGGIGKRAFEMKDLIIDEMIEVDENSIMEATKNVVLIEGITAEPSSSLFAAAIMANLDKFKNKKCVAVISGGNIDNNILKDIQEGN